MSISWTKILVRQCRGEEGAQNLEAISNIRIAFSINVAVLYAESKFNLGHRVSNRAWLSSAKDNSLTAQSAGDGPVLNVEQAHRLALGQAAT